ncbi:uncharacterized protein LOC119080044 [Bradysia coprophila]|uniref:uncharacterized protein LOC119080044 n=1 Tax=Bradysia coprophila TaxID=38358 RepID=UPI00187DA787|nr:uncharacterized protein LOC119080044 [Bradysia coprophila]
MSIQSGEQASRRESTDNSSHELVEKPKLISKTKITDLNYDCLFSIFKWMPINDAIAMCGICKKFVEPTKGIVRRFNSKNIFSLSEHIFCIKLPALTPAFYKTLYYMPSCPIKCIGQSLSKIYLDYDGTFKDSSVSVVEDSILNYCTELTELTLVNGKSAPFESIKKPIAKLKLLYLNNCILGPVFCQFSEWLPQLRTLSIINCYVLDASCIDNMGRTMPALESLHLDVVRKINNDEWSKGYTHCNTDEIMKRNGHVKHFRTTSNTNPRRLFNISKSMERLETLEFQAKKTKFQGSSNESINFKLVKTLVMKISGYERFPCLLVFDSLEELDFTSDSNLWKFFSRSNQIKKLKFYAVRHRTHLNDLLTISSTWPDLIEVSMHLSCVPLDEIIEFVHSLRNLRRFNFLKFICQYPSQTESEKFEEVKHHLSDEFKIVPGTDVNRFSLVRLN